MIYLDSGVEEDILGEAEQQLNHSGWRVWRREPDEIGLESRRTDALVVVKPLVLQ
ncbi:hypothetical protein AB0J35_58900 [Nonomuraea angiospora]|uniref:hypothetical protein n=1 Tax=Nonomuraea angiospora TaxID=46172 RepID=UPI00341D327F